MLDARPRDAAGMPLREAVHDGVAAVAQDHEEGADAVLDGAPERLDRVERGAVADDRDHGTVRLRHAHPDRSGEREAEPAHGRAEEAEWLDGPQPPVQLGPR